MKIIPLLYSTPSPSFLYHQYNTELTRPATKLIGHLTFFSSVLPAKKLKNSSNVFLKLRAEAVVWVSRALKILWPSRKHNKKKSTQLPTFYIFVGLTIFLLTKTSMFLNDSLDCDRTVVYNQNFEMFIVLNFIIACCQMKRNVFL